MAFSACSTRVGSGCGTCRLRGAGMGKGVGCVWQGVVEGL